MQTGLAGHMVMPAVDGFIEHVCVVSSETEYLLLEASARLSHEILNALIPQRCSVYSSVRYITAQTQFTSHSEEDAIVWARFVLQGTIVGVKSPSSGLVHRP
jgi:hypothetical protein